MGKILDKNTDVLFLYPEDFFEIMKRKRRLVVERWERVQNFTLNKDDLNGKWFEKE